MRPQDFSLLANATQEVADVLEQLATQHPDVFKSLGIRYPLADELGGYSGMLRDHVSTAQAVEAPQVKPELPEQQPSGVAQGVKTFNHMFTVAFTVISPNDGENVTADELKAGLLKRIQDLDRHDEWEEACGLPDDTYVESDSIEPDPGSQAATPNFDPSSQASLANLAFEAYDFGQGVTVTDTDGWQYTGPGGQTRSRSVYVETDENSSPTWRLTFTARFDPETGALSEAYAIDGKGQIWGGLPKRSAIELGVAKTNPDFNSDDVKAVAALQSSLLARHVNGAATDAIESVATHAINCYVIVRGEATEDEDEDVAGAYLVQLDLSRPVSEPGGVRHTFDEADHAEMATAVLNEFHEKLGISVLDDFEISVHLHGGEIITETDEERDTGLVVKADFCVKVGESELPFELPQAESSAPGLTPVP